MDICFATARQQLKMLADRDISAVELLEAHLQQIERCNPSVNAMVTLAEELARDQAAEVDRQRMDGRHLGLLAGLPVVHKDLTETRGIRTTYGSRIFEHHVPDTNSLLVDRLQQAGAVSLGKSNVPEWGAGSQTFNDVFGKTHNPYDLGRTCGGSSGGAAVALACGMASLADGSDMGGSLRNPANFCNVVGLRPSPGRVPSIPSQMAWATMGVQGPMARTVGDLALMLASISGPDARCPIALEQSGDLFTADLDMPRTNARIAVSPNFAHLPVEDVIQQQVLESAEIFASLGARVTEACPDFSAADEAFKTLRAWQFAATHQERLAEYRHLYKDTIIWNIEAGLKLSGADVARAEKLRTALFLQVEEFMQDYDYLLLPVSQVLPFDINTEYPTHISGVEMDTYIDWMKSCYYISAIGLPAISIPAGFSPEGLPIGIQLVGRHHDELGLLKLANLFENTTQCWRRRPPVTDIPT